MATDTDRYRLYSDLAAWWPLISPPDEYTEEAAFAARLLGQAARPVQEVLELGSGGGHNAVHLKQRFRLTLVDLSADMLAVSRRLNPECAHQQGDMRTLQLGRTFDARAWEIVAQSRNATPDPAGGAGAGVRSLFMGPLLAEAAALSGLCNDPAALEFLAASSFPDAKRPITKALLQRFDLAAILQRADRDRLRDRITTALVGELGIEPGPAIWEQVERTLTAINGGSEIL